MTAAATQIPTTAPVAARGETPPDGELAPPPVCAAAPPTVEPPLSPAATAPPSDDVSPQEFLNRDLSWLEFNSRVLHEAEDDRTPLLERVRFLAIFATNLDEFFMKRVGGLNRQ